MQSWKLWVCGKTKSNISNASYAFPHIWLKKLALESGEPMIMDKKKWPRNCYTIPCPCDAHGTAPSKDISDAST